MEVLKTRYRDAAEGNLRFRRTVGISVGATGSLISLFLSSNDCPIGIASGLAIGLAILVFLLQGGVAIAAWWPYDALTPIDHREDYDDYWKHYIRPVAESAIGNLVQNHLEALRSEQNQIERISKLYAWCLVGNIVSTPIVSIAFLLSKNGH